MMNIQQEVMQVRFLLKKWIEEQTGKIVKQTSPQKIILGLGAYSYDWSSNKDDNTSVTYMQAITKPVPVKQLLILMTILLI